MDDLLADIRACHICADLPLGPRPIIRAQTSAKILIIGQAPGTKVHETGVPWNDPSGDRLRDWMGLAPDQFYDDSTIAIMPMGLCYPGKVEKGGDKPPRPECAPAWHQKVLDELVNIKLTLLVGSYAQAYYLGKRRHKTMTDTIRHWQDYRRDNLFVLPHPSWRVTNLIQKNPWLSTEVFPQLKQDVRALI
ncbi:uracil-DNA glycosylase family protein [Terasakiella pusilla]|uniref:uracil-DNA glycosylase family protein n=1 Tax=Terasakiella pusilla TaxID=64973 RepID=UPI003AA94940